MGSRLESLRAIARSANAQVIGEMNALTDQRAEEKARRVSGDHALKILDIR